MTYTHLTPTELVMIEAYFNQSHSVSKVAHLVQRSRQTIYNVYCFLKSGGSAISYYEQYKKNKRNCGRRPIVLPDGQQEYIQKKGGSRVDSRCPYWSSRVSYCLFGTYTISDV